MLSLKSTSSVPIAFSSLASMMSVNLEQPAKQDQKANVLDEGRVKQGEWTRRIETDKKRGRKDKASKRAYLQSHINRSTVRPSTRDLYYLYAG